VRLYCMLQDKDRTREEIVLSEELVLRVQRGGNTIVQFFPVSFSEFIIDNVYGKKERERVAQTGCRKIYCG
jgi:hypothetical protein